MKRNRPGRGTAVAVLIGASAFPRSASLEPTASFASSAKGFADYLKTRLGLPDDDILDLFDDERQPGQQIDAISAFLSAKIAQIGSDLRDAIFYYCGHGTYLSEEEYALALKCTNHKAKGATTFKISYLVEIISDLTAEMRNLVILDACYAGGALGGFVRMSDGDEVEMVVRQVFDGGVADAQSTTEDDEGGAVLFCAAGPRKWAKAPLGSEHTMFTGALLATLKAGDARDGGDLSLKRVAKLVNAEIKRSFGQESVQSQIHVPVQGSGDLLDGPYFPNPHAIEPADPPPEKSSRPKPRPVPTEAQTPGLPVKSIAAVLAAVGLAITIAVLVTRTTTVETRLYSSARELYGDAVTSAGLKADDALFETLKLPQDFVGKRLKLLSFTSFEGTVDDRDWWGLVQPGELPIAPFPPSRPNGPVEDPSVALSGIKSKNYAPPTIPVVNGIATMTADRVSTVFPVDGLKKVYLRYFVKSNTNPQPAATHNCGSWLAVLHRVDGGTWTRDMNICGFNPADADSRKFQAGLVPFTIPPGSRTFEVAFAFEIQKVTAPINGAEFVLDDVSLIGEAR